MAPTVPVAVMFNVDFEPDQGCSHRQTLAVNGIDVFRKEKNFLQLKTRLSCYSPSSSVNLQSFRLWFPFL